MIACEPRHWIARMRHGGDAGGTLCAEGPVRNRVAVGIAMVVGIPVGVCSVACLCGGVVGLVNMADSAEQQALIQERALKEAIEEANTLDDEKQAAEKAVESDEEAVEAAGEEVTAEVVEEAPAAPAPRPRPVSGPRTMTRSRPAPSPAPEPSEPETEEEQAEAIDDVLEDFVIEDLDTEPETRRKRRN